VLFRHGERTTYKFYPTDPYKNETFYPVGPGGLTNRGKLTEFTLGSILREQYGNLLGEDYTDDKLEVRSTDTPRTEMSAMLVLAGLWPPSQSQRWHPTLMWQPIPVFTKPFENEDLLDSTYCDFRKVVLENLPKNPEIRSKFIDPHKSIFEYISKHSGLVIKDLLDLLNFYFIVKSEDDVGLELPEWTKKIYPEPLYSTASLVYEYLNIDPDVKKIHAGYFLQKMVNDSVAKINNELEPAGRKMFLYSAHETTLGYVLHALKVSKPHIPPYGSAIILELHQRKQEYLFKLRYLEDPLEPHIQDFTTPGCDTLCPVNKFIELQSEILPIVSFREACDIRNTTS